MEQKKDTIELSLQDVAAVVLSAQISEGRPVPKIVSEIFGNPSPNKTDRIWNIVKRDPIVTETREVLDEETQLPVGHYVKERDPYQEKKEIIKKLISPDLLRDIEHIGQCVKRTDEGISMALDGDRKVHATHGDDLVIPNSMTLSLLKDRIAQLAVKHGGRVELDISKENLEAKRAELPPCEEEYREVPPYAHEPRDPWSSALGTAQPSGYRVLIEAQKRALEEGVELPPM